MSTLTEEFPKRLSLSMLISVALHGAVIAGLLYASFNQVLNVPTPQAAISVSMVAPEVQPEAAISQPQPVAQPVTPPTPQDVQPQPAPEPEPAPEPPLDKPVPIEKPEPKPKPKPEVKRHHEVKKKAVKPKPVVKSPEKPVTENNQTLTAQQKTNPADQTKAQTAPEKSNQQSISVGKPQSVSITSPAYPARALAFHLEGRVKVKFDVDAEGNVVNAQIIEAQPKNMFDREVKQAMRHWRYQSGKPGTGLTMTIVFKIDGSSSVE